MKILFGKKLEKLYKTLEEKDDMIDKLEQALEMYEDKKDGNPICGCHCAYCEHGYAIFNATLPYTSYGCKLNIPCDNYKDNGRKNQ